MGEAVAAMRTSVEHVVHEALNHHIGAIESRLDADAVGFFGPIVFGVDHALRDALDDLEDRKGRLVVVLDTGGGVVEVVERLVDLTRHFYSEVDFIIPDRAMSAGTVFALSGDKIWMDHFSLMGPIDPQLPRDKKLVPALAYLKQFEKLMEKAESGQLTTPEVVLLQKLDLAELQQFEYARDLAINLLKKWLVKYKFKDWKTKETSGDPVSEEEREQRAAAIAASLSDPAVWHSHARGITMERLRGDDIKLRIDDFGTDPALSGPVRKYFKVLREFMDRTSLQTMIHTRNHF